MMRCHDCRNLLLDRAYGLLDEAENATIDAHLAECPACAAAAGREQGLIAAAAKSSFPNVSFAPPVEEPVLPFTPRRKAKASWVQWAVAASVLAMIPGTLIPAGKLAERYQSARQGVSDAADRTAKLGSDYQKQAADTALRDQVAAAEKKHLSVVSGWVNDAKAEASRKVKVDVTKPQSVMPGAPNEYVIAIQDPSNSLNGSTVEAQFRDESGAVLHAQPLPAKSATVKLPAEVWKRIAPQSDLVLSVSAVNAAGARTELLEPIRLYGPVYATLLTTDKTAYRPGEQIHFRSLTLDRITLRPPVREQNLRFTLHKADGTGKVLERSGSTNLMKDAAGELVPVNDAKGDPIRGVGCGSFLLPADLPEGEYVLTLTETGTSPAIASPVTKSIRIRAGGPEKFTKKLTFHSPTYAANQPVIATVELKLGEKPVVGAKGTILLTSDKDEGPFFIMPKPQARKPDGNPLLLTGLTDDNGRFRIEFTLPAGTDIKLMVTFDELGGGESVIERVPLAGGNVKIEFFPEGGKLLAGVPNRVYVRGTNANGKPIDVRGTIVAGNEIVAKVDAPVVDEEPGVHRGVGSFTFTPKADAKYQLRLLNANLGAAPAELPKAEATGVTFTALDTVVKPGQPIRVRVHSVGQDRKLVVGAYTRGRLADTQSVQVKAEVPAVVTLLAKPDSRGGVTRVTVFEEAGKELVPVAERLVFRKPGETLNLAATPAVNDRAVDLAVLATDEKGNPIPAILWAAAVNAAVAPDAKHRALPTHFLLGGEVQTPDELEHADFLLTDHPKAADALDHVLATQGWRRFVEQKATAVAGSAHESLLHAHGAKRLKDAGRSLIEKYWSQFEASSKEVDTARQKHEANEPVMLKLYAEYESSRLATQDFATAVQAAAEPYDRIRDRLSLATGCVSVLCVMLGLLAAARGMSWFGTLPYVVGALTAGGMAVHYTLDASRNPATVPVVTIDKLDAPKPVPRPADPDVKPRQPKNDGSVEGEKYQLFGIPEGKLFPARGPAPLNVKASIPGELPKMNFRPAPGQTVIDAILAAEKRLEAKADSAAKERAFAALRKIEAALLASGAASDPAAEQVRDAAPFARPLVVREYAPSAPVTDDADTIFWNPVIVLPTDGRTHLKFQLGTAPGGYQVIVAGHSPDGRLGSTKLHLPAK
jgi:hypothetical protein